ncbi:hypothetical protein DR83_1454 [Francisella tularensis subsp. novicida]|nr:hypothetical protein AS84_1601 [Francisella tularensis subsp. novicida F6168]AJJ46669.1 putative transposase, IS4 [Francisella tularensis subsp. novicida]AJJ47676.1 putative transposase, IS4 [Francisella tularensis subsp. novicida]APC98226.1 putative transposase, IS4 [Francisella tularensis subsp. novicida]KFJ69918.1 hypothetical protein DR83_1454 [Francisella tularensis subsp. novicida]
MIDQLILTFCRIDDFLFIIKNYKASQLITKKAGLKTSLSLSEIMIILVMYQAVRFKDFKT